METNTAFVRADCIVELYAITEVSLYFTIVVYPCNTESEDAIRLYNSFNNLGFFKLRMFIVYVFN